MGLVVLKAFLFYFDLIISMQVGNTDVHLALKRMNILLFVS